MSQFAPHPRRAIVFAANLSGFEDCCAGKIILCQKINSGARMPLPEICLIGEGRDVRGQTISVADSDRRVPIQEARQEDILLVLSRALITSWNQHKELLPEDAIPMGGAHALRISDTLYVSGESGSFGKLPLAPLVACANAIGLTVVAGDGVNGALDSRSK